MFLLKGSAERVVTIGTAADDRFFVPDESGAIPGEAQALFQKLGIAGPFAPLRRFDGVPQHRSFAEMIEAFAMLPVKSRHAHQLVLTYDLSPQAKSAVPVSVLRSTASLPGWFSQTGSWRSALIVIPAVCRLRYVV